MGESVEHCWKLYRGKEAVYAGGERKRKAKTRIEDFATINPEIGTRSILTQSRLLDKLVE